MAPIIVNCEENTQLSLKCASKNCNATNGEKWGKILNMAEPMKGKGEGQDKTTQQKRTLLLTFLFSYSTNIQWEGVRECAEGGEGEIK